MPVPDPVAIAFIGPLTGGPAARGLGGRNASMLAVAGRSAAWSQAVRLVVLDDACDPAQGVAAARAAVADRSIVAAVAHYCSRVAMRTAPEFEAGGLPTVLWGAHEAGITDDNAYRFVHRVCGTNRLESDSAARFLRARGHRRWALLRDTTHYGEDHAGQFARSLAGEGGAIAHQEAVDPLAPDIEPVLDRIAAAAPDVVYLAAAPPPWWSANAAAGVTPPHRRPGWVPLTARLRLGLARRGVSAVIQGTSGVVRDPGYLAHAGDLAEGTLAFEELVPLDHLPGGTAFMRAYEAAGFAEPAEDFGPHAFAATELVLDVVTRVGADRARICAALNATADHPSILGPITFDARRQNIAAPMEPYVVQDGAWRLWADSDYATGRRRLPPPRD